MVNNLEFYRRMKMNLKATCAKTVGTCDICGEERDLTACDDYYYCKNCLEQAFYEAQQDVNAKHGEELVEGEDKEDLQPETRFGYNLNE